MALSHLPISYVELTTGFMVTTNASVDVQLHAPNSLAAIIESTTLAIIMVISILANLVAIVTIFRVPMLRRNPHNILILNLTFGDIGVALTTMVFSMISIFDGGRLLEDSPVLCKFNGFCTVLLSASSFATITCIAIDRYLAVVWSARFPPSHCRACAMVVGIWCFSASYAALPLVDFLSSFEYLDGTHHCSPIWENCFFYVVGFMINYVITIPIMLVCYIFIFRAIWKKQMRLKEYRAAAKSLPYSQQSFDETAMESESKTADVLYFSPVEPSYNSFTKSFDDCTDNGGVRRMSMSLSLPHLDILDQAERPLNMPKVAYCAGDCRLSGFGKCPDCRTAQRQQARGGGKSVQRSATTIGPSKKKSIRRQAQKRSASTERQNSLRSFDMADIGVDRRQRKSSKNLDRSGSFFSLTTLRLKSFGSSRWNSAGKDNKKNRKMYAKRMKKLRADKQVALTGSFLILSSLLCWLPYAITRSCFFPVHTKHWVDITAMWISFINTFLDPVIYALMNRRVKAKLREDFRAFRRCIMCLGKDEQ